MLDNIHIIREEKNSIIQIVDQRLLMSPTQPINLAPPPSKNPLLNMQLRTSTVRVNRKGER